MLGSFWQYVYASFLRYWMKWLIRQATGTCELQRILSGYEPGATRTMKTEYSLYSSRSQVLRDSLKVCDKNWDDCLSEIMKEKRVKHEKDPQFREKLHTSLLQITGYKNLYSSVEDMRKEVFSADDQEHEAMLLKLWDLLMPAVKLESRVTKQWGDIGFQGEDPKTDFRGMGLLGLINLVFFSQNYTEEARLVLSHANHPKLGYSYAIVGINLTEMAYSLLKSGALKPHFYNTVAGPAEARHFHQLYCYLAFEFDKFWIAEEPESIMHFNQYREKFHDIIKTQLKDPDVSLTLTAPTKQ